MSRRRFVVAGAAAAGGVAVAAGRGRSRRRVAFPPPDDALRVEDAAGHAARLLGRDAVRRRDLAMALAPTSATRVEPLLHGRRYFPRMLDDIAAATDHVHLLIYGIKPGDIATRFRDVLLERAAAGVSVRIQVDAIGSEIDFGSKALFAELVAGGVQVVAHDGVAVVRSGPLGKRRVRTHVEDLLHFDHRKLAVIDGRVGYVGGSGIEDHYADERFYDVMCRVEGPIVHQLQLVILASWRHEGGDVPDELPLPAWFPEATLAVADPAAAIPTTVLWNVPGTGHHPISDAIESSLAGASQRVDIVNPYISNRAILVELLKAAQRGVPVRLIAPGKPTPPYPAAAFRHHYARLQEAGVEILLHPEMAHAKVLRIDDRVLIGGCNLDDLSLFRNDELDLLFEHPSMPALAEETVFTELAAMSTPAVASTRRRDRWWDASMDRVSRWL